MGSLDPNAGFSRSIGLARSLFKPKKEKVLPSAWTYGCRHRTGRVKSWGFRKKISSLLSKKPLIEEKDICKKGSSSKKRGRTKRKMGKWPKRYI